MESHRHPNPLVDVRKPMNGSIADLNPPGFVWRPIDSAHQYEVKISSDREFDSAHTQLYTIEGRTLWVSPDTLPRGIYHWRWRALGAGQDDVWSETFTFHITEDTAELRVPSGAEVVSRIDGAHPRHMLTVERLETFRESCKSGDQADEWRGLRQRADVRLAKNWLIQEPPFLPDRAREPVLWSQIRKNWTGGSNQMGQDAQLFALVYLIDGEDAFGEAAAERLLEFASWDEEGSSSTFHHNAPHMAVTNLGPRAYDWAHAAMSEDDQSTVREALRRRGNMTMERFRRANYGITGSDNHSGRLLGFLGECGIALAGECEDVESWFDFILPTMVAMYPWWGGREGGWAQGVSYASTYCYLNYHFLFGLREAAGVDFYKKPFFRAHGDWRLLCVPPNAYMIPFGDGRTEGRNSVIASWGIQRHLGRIYGDNRLLKHAEQCYKAGGDQLVESRGLTSPLSFLTPQTAATDETIPKSDAQLFSDIGWLAIRTDLHEPENDIRFMMRASQYGSESHSHADQNAFAIEAFGEPLAVPSGLYNLYSSAHHHGWTRQTKAANAVTFDDAGQIPRSVDAVGRFTGFWKDDRVIFARGEASAAYGDRVKTSERTVLFIDNRFFVLVDRMVPTYEAMWTWHLHSVRPMDIHPGEKRATIRYDKASLEVAFCHGDELIFKSHEGWDVLPYGYEKEEDIPEESARFHLDVSSIIPVNNDILVTVMCPNRDGMEIPKFETVGGNGACIKTSNSEILILADKTGDGIDESGYESDAEIMLAMKDSSDALERAYTIGGGHVTMGKTKVCSIVIDPNETPH
ncbi:MAG: DUF4962 domain-containing protein [Candidatus Latescibacterota bacterium]|nr:DUF4962 domain-containing protein [Candidatus Latescibacterota bacterium]